MSYNSIPETQKHIGKVQSNLREVLVNLCDRITNHDSSKLFSPEKEAFDSLDPAKMAKVEYGSPEYKAQLKKIEPALKHHYRANDHHPEHFPNGIDGMSLMALCEMLADWKAAGERNKGGNLADSLFKNRSRFAIGPQLASILQATAQELGWF